MYRFWLSRDNPSARIYFTSYYIEIRTASAALFRERSTRSESSQIRASEYLRENSEATKVEEDAITIGHLEAILTDRE